MKGRFEEVKTRVRSFLLLDAAERTVRARGPGQHAAIRATCDAAARRTSVADELSDDRGAVAALVLYREAAVLLAAAIAAANEAGEGAAATPEEEPVATLERLAKAGAIPAPPPDVEEALRFLGQSPSLAFDELSSDELLRRRFACESALRWLRGRVEARTLPEIRASRTVRVGASAAAAVIVLAWAILHLVRPTNLALGKPVTISSRHPASTAPPDNSGFVNGKIEGSYGIHTAEGGAWVMVDLLASHKLSEIRIYNRGDGWFDAGLPFTLELSQDGKTFTVVETRTAGFSSAEPWIFKAQGKPARYIRIRSKTYIALTELEAYGAN
jgi:hypothetical protein